MLFEGSAVSETARSVDGMHYFMTAARFLRNLPKAALYSAAAVAAVATLYLLWLSPVAVTAYPVRQGPIADEVMGTGTLEAETRAVVSSKIGGLLVSAPVDQGDRVRTGQVMARLDDAELRQQAAIAEAQLDAALAAEKRLLAELERARVIADQRQRDDRRKQRLHAGRVVPDSDAEKSLEEIRTARAELARSEAALQEAEKLVHAARKTLAYHKARLADTVIVAPFDGLIIKRIRNAGDMVVPGSEIFRLVSLQVLWISAWVDETRMSGLAPGQRARIYFRSQPERAYPGTVARLGLESDRETRECIVDVRIDELPGQWAIGQRAEVFIETARRVDALLIPAQALAYEAGAAGVYVIRTGKVVWQPVRPGLRTSRQVEVPEGLADGELVIDAAGLRSKKLKPGSRVKARGP